MARRVLVTGATGFIGRHLVPYLRGSGWEVVAPERRELAPDTQWRDALQGVEAVVHLAAIAHERALACERSRDYEPLRRVNVLGAARLAREAAAAGVRQLVFMSSIGVCGDETDGAPFTEASVPAPRSLYARSKLEAELALAEVAAASAMRVVALRPTLVYGPENGGNFLRLLRAVAAGWPLPLASVSNRRHLTYLGNLASAVAAALSTPSTGGPLVVCDREAVSTPELVRALAEGMAVTPRLVRVPPRWLLFAGGALGRRDTVRRLVGSLEADASRAQRALGWTPPFAAGEALRSTGRWYAQR